MKRIYITGTDTEIGKTRVACQLLEALRAAGYSALGYKPVASGAEDRGEGLVNEDALALMAASSRRLEYSEVNPWCFAEAVAPHILAMEAGIAIEPEKIRAIIDRQSADIAVVEGVGGWLAPLDGQVMQADMARCLGAGVILVVGMRLGCINHSLLSVDRIVADGLPLLGWVANRVDPEMPRYRENIETLKARIETPMLAEIGWFEDLPRFRLGRLGL